MAKSGLETFIRIAKQVSREAERSRKKQNRLAAQEFRAAEREERRLEREWAAEERQRARDIKAQHIENVQAFLEAGQSALTTRCQKRAALRETMLRELFS